VPGTAVVLPGSVGLIVTDSAGAAYGILSAFSVGSGGGGSGPSAIGRGFKSFDALKRALGPVGPGKVWHHIVEQSQIGRFGAEAIHNTRNVVAVTVEVNRRLNALYSSIRFDITGSTTMTVRQWLSTLSYERAHAFGLRALENVSRGVWP
jgi:hypothetical protein